jgi:hypothetical protein
MLYFTCQNPLSGKFRVANIRTPQQWMRHRNIASTMAYPKDWNKDVQARLNKGSLATFA